eukprot:11187675-Lingulodinium_polyedra.AAC.1
MRLYGEGLLSVAMGCRRAFLKNRQFRTQRSRGQRSSSPSAPCHTSGRRWQQRGRSTECRGAARARLHEA